MASKSTGRENYAPVFWTFFAMRLICAALILKLNLRYKKTFTIIDLITFSQFQAACQESVQEPLEANLEASHLHVSCRLLHLWLRVGLP